MTHSSCPGYAAQPFRELVADHPDEAVYPSGDFRTEWGPIFHRGRLDGSARVLVLGQDPATHESITRRILVGEAGQRVQGLLTKIGITDSYVMVNAFLYSVYGQGGGTRHAKDPLIAAYRNRWLDALLLSSQVTAVITFGQLAKTAYAMWTPTQPARAAELHVAQVRHPTYPESSSASGATTLAGATAALLDNWNDALPGLRQSVQPDTAISAQAARPYGTKWEEGDLSPIPEADLPAGSPAWWRGLEAWASRTGSSAQAKRATITLTVPEVARTWPAPGR